MRLGTNNTVIVIGANLALMWLFLATGFASGPDHHPLPDNAPIPTRLRGDRCYRVSFSHAYWNPQLTPHEFELDSASRWTMAGTDSIDIWLTTAIPVGVVIRASIKNDTLTGRAWEIYDTSVDWVPPDAMARAVPISCADVSSTARRAP